MMDSQEVNLRALEMARLDIGGCAPLEKIMNLAKLYARFLARNNPHAPIEVD